MAWLQDGHFVTHSEIWLHFRAMWQKIEQFSKGSHIQPAKGYGRSFVDC